MGDKIVISSPGSSNSVVLYDFFLRTMNRLLFQNSKKYKKIKVVRIKKFMNFDRLWLELAKHV